MGRLNKAYEEQLKFQNKLSCLELPVDSIQHVSYHLRALDEEIGEFCLADKRWKDIRNSHYDREEKLSELADVFITIFNLSLYSGFSLDELSEAILNKIGENNVRLQNERK